MNLSKSAIGFVIAILGIFTISANAQTTNSGCTWQQVGVQNIPSGAIVYSSCKINDTTIANRTQTYSAYNPTTCSITWIASGYTQTGTCANATFGTQTPPNCNTGASTVVQTGPGMPAFNATAFCGQSCPYSVQPLASHSYPPLRYTCL